MGAHRRYSLRYGPNCRTVCGRLHTRSVCSQHYRIHSQGLRSAQTAASLGRSGFTVGQARWAALVAARVASGPGLWTAAQSSHPARCVGALCSLRRETDGSTDERRATNPCAKSPRRAGHPTPLCRRGCPMFMPPTGSVRPLVKQCVIGPGKYRLQTIPGALQARVNGTAGCVCTPGAGRHSADVCTAHRPTRHRARSRCAPAAQPMRCRCAVDALPMRCPM